MILTNDHIKKMRENFTKDPTLQVARRAVTKNGILASAQNEHDIDINDFVFSVDVDSESVANQKQSGRCWMFACLNTLRFRIEENLNLRKGEFQLSQSYSFFYDKLEKANIFYEQMIALADKSIDDRQVTFLLNMPQQDGGDWCQISGLLTKYGTMPRTAMGETTVSVSSSEMDTILNRKMRQDALVLRKLAREGASTEELDAKRLELLDGIYKIVAVCLGQPPETFDFEYRDKDGNYHLDRDLTPQEFFKKYVPTDPADYVGIISVPIDSMPFGKLYGIEGSDEPIGGRPNRYINVPMDTLKELAIKQLKEGEPVWFGCDVLQSSDLVKGLMSTDLYKLDELFGVDFTMDKGERYLTRESLPTHAMVLAGVDLVDDKPTRWKVENSWGTEKNDLPVGHNGYFIMTDDWMDQYTYEVAIRKDLLSDELKALLDTDPIILPFWSSFNPLP